MTADVLYRLLLAERYGPATPAAPALDTAQAVRRRVLATLPAPGYGMRQRDGDR